MKRNIAISKYIGFISVIVAAGSLNQSAFSYPEFQSYSEKHSGQPANCAMCHTNGNGPNGNGPGQIDALDEEATKRLNEARKAFEPGQKVDNPILNEFGNNIVEKLGRKEVISLIKKPEDLATKLGKELDTDKDGIADGEEYLDGTDPTNKFHGNPWKLFKINFQKYQQHILLAFVAVIILNFGLSNLIKGIAVLTDKSK